MSTGGAACSSAAVGVAMTSDRHRVEARELAEYVYDDDLSIERLAQALAAAEERGRLEGVAAGLRAAALHGHPCTRCAELERLRDERRAYDDASALVESWR
jgi:hypothetical protein